MENILVYMTIGLGVIVIALFFWILYLSKKIRKMSNGKNSESLESIIIENNELGKTMRQKHENIEQNIIQLKSELAKTIKNISIVRFDALGDASGMQSFAIGLTDSYKNGIVISSMYTRDRMSVFAKEIIKGESNHKLTEEEKQAIT